MTTPRQPMMKSHELGTLHPAKLSPLAKDLLHAEPDGGVFCRGELIADWNQDGTLSFSINEPGDNDPVDIADLFARLSNIMPDVELGTGDTGRQIRVSIGRSCSCHHGWL